MLVSLNEYNRNVDRNDILVNRNTADPLQQCQPNMYMITQITPTIQMAKIKQIKENLIILSDQTIEYDSITTLKEENWFIDKEPSVEQYAQAQQLLSAWP